MHVRVVRPHQVSAKKPRPSRIGLKRSKGSEPHAVRRLFGTKPAMAARRGCVQAAERSGRANCPECHFHWPVTPRALEFRTWLDMNSANLALLSKAALLSSVFVKVDGFVSLTVCAVHDAPDAAMKLLCWNINALVCLCDA